MSSKKQKGFSRRAVGKVFELVSAASDEEMGLPWESCWIPSHICMRQCTRFVPVNHQTETEHVKDSVCFCGLPYYNHSKNSTINITPSSQTWSCDRDTKRLATDAFGEIDFVGYEDIQRKYVRVDEDTNMDDMLCILLKIWKLKRPNLLISVIGGSENFNMKTKLKDVFRRGLIKVSQSTGAWIITGGTNNGIAKHVGEAVRDYRLTSASTVPVITLGIATWGCIKNRNILKDTFGKGLWPASYTMEQSSENERCLDPNHTHFILVDNGTNGQLGAEIQFRSKLEKAIANIKTGMEKDDVTIPLVILLVQGSLNSLKSTLESISQGTPLVVVKGSGGLADIIAFAYESATEVEVIKIENNFQRKRSISVTNDKIVIKLKGMMIDAFGENDVEMNWLCVRNIIEKRDLVTVFDYRLSGIGTQEIDVSILKALLKANRDQVFDQLKLALAWNRIDIAKSEIFTDNKIWAPGSLKGIMHTAIVQNRVDFVDLFIDNGIPMKEFLTPQRLLYFYNTVPGHSVLQNLLDKARQKNNRSRDQRYEITDIKRLIKILVDINVEPCASTNYIGHYNNVKKESKFPFEDLFVWSVLLNRQDMAKLFWRQGKDATAYALLAFGILYAMAERTDDTELRKSLSKNADEFGDLAVGVINECFETDEKKTNDLLTRKIEQFDGATCLKIALKTDNKQFISQPACQEFYRNVWMGELSHENGTFRLFVSPFVLGVFLLKVKEKIIKREDNTTDKSDINHVNRKSPYLERKWHLKKHSNTLEGGNTNGQHCSIEQRESVTPTQVYKEDKLTGFQLLLYRLRCIYTAPVMIFAHNVIGYIVFLSAFSYMLLVEFSRDVGLIEKLIFVWVLTLMIEEIRQFSSTTQRKEKQKFTVTSFLQKMCKKRDEYFSDIWNQIDVLTISLFILGLILRFSSNIPIVYARIAYGFSLMAFFFRILHIFTVHKELGPKILMIKRMMVDLVFFLIILMVFVLSYSITSFAIMYPNSTLTWDLVHRILRRGYWNLYGELFLEEIEGQSKCTTNSTMYENNVLSRCAEVPTIGIVLMAVYTLFANVLLLNILIAMFSNTFQNVQENTDNLWNYMRCSLVYEFYNKPFLPAPLSLPMYVYLGFKWIIVRLCGCCQPEQAFTELHDREIIQWENIIADAYTQRIKRDLQNKVETKVYEMNERLDTLMVRMCEVQTAYESSSHFDRRMDFLDEKLTKILMLVSKRTDAEDEIPPNE